MRISLGSRIRQGREPACARRADRTREGAAHTLTKPTIGVRQHHTRQDDAGDDQPDTPLVWGRCPAGTPAFCADLYRGGNRRKVVSAVTGPEGRPGSDLTQPPIRVALADDSFMVREAVGKIMTAAPEVEIVASCSDADSLIEAVERLSPAVVVTDIRRSEEHTSELQSQR